MPDAAAVSRRLGVCLDAPVARLAVLASGWETTVFEFVLAGRSSRLPGAEVGQPLVLRSYDGPDADAKGIREARTMAALATADYPVPKPLLFEPERAPLGAPFLIMERARGGPLFASGNFPQAFKTFSMGFVGFVRAQAQLHRLARNGFDPRNIAPAYLADHCAHGGALLDRLLEVVAQRIECGPLPGLRDALILLREQAGRFRTAPDAIVHMDYHPQNVVVQGLRVTGVIDWVSADHGDRHLCAATTSVILASSAMDHPRWMRDNAAGNALRALFTALYLPLYQALAPMEWERFRYCQAVAALLRLSTFGIMRARGPAAAGYRPEAIANVTPGVVRLLSRYTGRKAGTPVAIPAAS
ncbi:MAG TPA: phosphotransferase [Candidatus Binataceae bacterium]|nr:phosphotransferase [Candidatus Binataceae bacterium]